MNPDCGIYCFTLRGTKRCYVGSSRTIVKRRNRHLTEARGGSEFRFHRALREFGEDAFTFEILALCAEKDLHATEDFFMLLKGATGVDGFNVRTKAAGGYVSGECSAATRERLRMKGMGRKVSTETRQKLSQRFKGRKITEEQKQKMSLAGKLRPPPAYATLKSVEFTKGVPRSAEVKAKISAGHMGKTCPEEVKRRISQKLTGRSLPEATVEKMRAAQLRRWSKVRENRSRVKSCPDKRSFSDTSA